MLITVKKKKNAEINHHHHNHHHIARNCLVFQCFSDWLGLMTYEDSLSCSKAGGEFMGSKHGRTLELKTQENENQNTQRGSSTGGAKHMPYMLYS
jgi:hypothetical protein